MERGRALIIANALALAVLITVSTAGWWDAAGFGLAVLVVMDLTVVIRGRSSRFRGDSDP